MTLIDQLKEIPVASGYLDDLAIKRILQVLAAESYDPSKDPNMYLDKQGNWQPYVHP